MSVAIILRPAVVLSAVLILLPMFSFALFPAQVHELTKRLSRGMRICGPLVFCVPYALVAYSFGIFSWRWLALYCLLPIAISATMEQARSIDPNQRGNWRDYVVLVVLGLAVDLRWVAPAWPAGLAALGKMLLLDAGIFGFLWVRQLDGVGFSLRLGWGDATIGLREFFLFAIISIPLGLGMGFLHFHALWPTPIRFAGAFLFTFFFIAIPEELFFRGWLQNLLERRIGRTGALLLTAVLFGLAHWNKRTASFNWRYVLMAALGGIFYGRAWRAQRRVGASAQSHALVDTLWSIWLR